MEPSQKIDHILSNKQSKTSQIQNKKQTKKNTCILFNHHGLNLEFNNNITPRKPTNAIKLNSELLNQPLVKK